jgi:exodeoxyribonuclease VII large subunit
MTGESAKLTLLELNRRLKEGIQGIFPGGIWVIAEISDMNVNQSGHCYLELIEKNGNSESITAKARATIWSLTFRILRPYFESITGQRFAPGIKILINVTVDFHELYGLSLNIKDIDPNYTIGDLAKRKQEIINRLTSLGIIDKNKTLELPDICRNIAVISSETAAGYGDFIKQLKHNKRGFKFEISLFHATMQGEDTERSVTEALSKIYKDHRKFDIVVIIRGGGSQAELNYFNNYNIAYQITQCPIPVFTGIGHDRDQTIADIVAHSSLKTPTAVAEHILSLMEQTAQYLETIESDLITLVSAFITEQKSFLGNLSSGIRNLNKYQLNNLQNRYAILENNFNQKVRNQLPRRKAALNQLQDQLSACLKYNLLMHKLHVSRLEQTFPLSAKAFLKKEKNRLQAAENLISAYNPVNILNRGYSITYANGKVLRSPVEVKEGETIETRLKEGCISSIVK